MGSGEGVVKVGCIRAWRARPDLDGETGGGTGGRGNERQVPVICLHEGVRPVQLCGRCNEKRN